MDHTKELIELAHAGNREARDFLVLQNMGLVYSVAKRFFNRGYDMEDITQIGTIGLIKAIDKFDLSFNVQFSTYAVPLIIGEIKQSFRDAGCIKVGRKLKELYISINEYKKNYREKNNVDPRIDEISSFLNVSVHDVILALESHFYPTSLDETIYEKENSEIKLKDTIYENETFSSLDYIVLDEAINRLSKYEKMIIYLRYYEGCNQSDVASKIGTSQVQVSRIEKQIIEKLRKEFV